MKIVSSFIESKNADFYCCGRKIWIEQGTKQQIEKNNHLACIEIESNQMAEKTLYMHKYWNLHNEKSISTTLGPTCSNEKPSCQNINSIHVENPSLRMMVFASASATATASRGIAMDTNIAFVLLFVLALGAFVIIACTSPD